MGRLQSEKLRRQGKYGLYSRNHNDFATRLPQITEALAEHLAMFAGAVALGLEGVVAKDAHSPSVEGPRATWHWQKIKNKDYKRQGKVELGSHEVRFDRYCGENA